MASSIKQKGFGLLEVVIGLGILAVAFFSLITVSESILRVSRTNSDMIQADYLLQEGAEAMRSIRDGGWTPYIMPLSVFANTNIKFYIAQSGQQWQATSTPEIIGKFYRYVQVANVYRGPTQDIVQSGGTLDNNTRKFTVTVAWPEAGATTTRSSSFYLTNYFND